MNYLIAIDSDGTLRKTDGSVSAFTKDVIKRVQEKQNIVLIATARPRYHTLELSNKIGINDYFISSNGAEVFDIKNNNVIYANYISKNDCLKVYNETKNLGLRAMFVYDNTEYVTLFKRNDNQVLLDDNNIGELKEKNIKQITVISNDKENLLSYKKMISQSKSIRVIDSSTENNNEIWFSIVNKDSSKGKALEELAKYLNISQDKVVAIGNDSNDLSMINYANYSIAVSNANEEILDSAKCIIKSNDEDGVAYYLEEHFL